MLTKDCLQITVNVARAGVPEKLAEMDIVVDVGAVHTHARTHTHTNTHTHTHILDNVCGTRQEREPWTLLVETSRVCEKVSFRGGCMMGVFLAGV